MAMLSDGPPSTIEDLTLRDSDLLNVSVSEGIDLTAKLHLAANDIGTTIESLLLSALPSCADIRYSFPSLRHIGVTPPLRLWHTYTTLRLVYQDLYYSRLNDRYQAKMNLYQSEETRALSELRTNGFGVVFDPLPQALPPGLGTIPSAAAGGTTYVGVTYVNQKAEEGLMSIPMEVDTQNGHAAVVRIIGLENRAVVGWNLYAGLVPDKLTRQNADVLALATSVTIAPGTLTTGAKPGLGQHANLLFPMPRRILRG